MFELNTVGAVIWQQLASNVPADMIVGYLVELFGASHEQANRDVTNFVEVLKKHWLVYDDEQFTTSAPSISP